MYKKTIKHFTDIALHQAVITGVGSLIGILFNNSVIELNPEPDTMAYYLYTIFLNGPNYTILGLNITSSTFGNMLWIYFVLTVAWVTMNQLVVGTLKAENIRYLKIFIMCWCCILLAITIFDLTIAGLLVSDLKKWVNFQQMWFVDTTPAKNATLLIIALILRGGFFLVFNIVAIVLMLRYSIILKESRIIVHVVAPQQMQMSSTPVILSTNTNRSHCGMEGPPPPYTEREQPYNTNWEQYSNTSRRLSK